MQTAQRVFKEAKQQRSEGGDPWAESNASDGDSDWIIAGGGGQSGDEQASPGGATGDASEASGEPRDLEGEFEKSLEDYDGKIMDERAIIVASANRRAGERDLPQPPQGAASGDAAGGEGTTGSEGGEPGGPTGGVPTSGASDIPTTMPPKNTTPGDYKPVQVARVPADIPSGDDDDIVARQLREAAMNEEDPELREKLWDEYRKYKNATQ